MKPPLSDDPARLHVLDLGRLLAGPVVATLLGDLQAEVIKVGRPGTGDLQRGVFPQAPADPGMPYAREVARLRAWEASGELAHREDIVKGFERAPAAFLRLFSGANRGEQLLRL